MTSVRERLIHLHHCKGITRPILKKILRKDPSLKIIYNLSSSEFNRQLLISNQKASLIHFDIHNEELKKNIHSSLKNTTAITIFDKTYPSILKQIKDPPLVLYGKGDVSLLKRTPSLSVIGTRGPSLEAGKKIKHIVIPLIKQDWTIISGMAKGIDSYAHQLALYYGGKTIAVLGGGFDHVYPRENLKLFHKIVKNGLVLTEYPFFMRPERYHFPERNRIISGLSYGTLVIEAMEKSGTIITVDQALDQGREVYAVPGSPLIPQTKGCHQMIQDGAKLVYESNDIIEDWETIGTHLLNHFQ